MKIVKCLPAALLLVFLHSEVGSQAGQPIEQSTRKASRLGGLYTIQQKINKRYVDAHESGKYDYRLVTRDQQDDPSQNWMIIHLSDDIYSIQQASNERYVDAHESRKRGHDHGLVTRTYQDNGTQKWIVLPLGDDIYTIQQLVNDRYVDAHESDKYDFALVTRTYQDNDTQKWIIKLHPDDLKFLRIEYSLDEAEIASEVPKIIATQVLANNTQNIQEMTFNLKERRTKTSYFEHSHGLNITVAAGFSYPTPAVSVGGSVSVSQENEWTWGEENSLTTEIEQNLPLTADPHRTYKATARVVETKLNVPYVMFFRSEATGAEHKSYGTWGGVSVSDSTYTIDDIKEGEEY